MSTEWPYCRLEELAASREGAIAIGPFGSRMKSDCYVASGVGIIRGTNLAESRSLSGEFVYVSEEKARELGNANVRPGDLVFPHRGNIGAVGIVPDDGLRYALSTSLMKISLDLQCASPSFYYYFFRSPRGQAELLKNASQVGTPGIATPLTSLRGCVVPCPSLKEQEAVVAILSPLDDRIALLRETNATLEAVARALFKSWFVNFDPVRANAEERKPAELSEEVAGIFPNRFEESGEMPLGWTYVPFSTTIKVIGGGTPKTSIPEYWDGEIPWFSIVDAPASSDVFVLDTEKHVTRLGVENSSTKILPEGTTIISARGTVGRLALVGSEMAMNQSCYGLRGVAGDTYFTYFSTHRLVETLKQRSHGSVFDTITTQTLASVSLVYPPSEIIDVFEALIEPCMLRIKENVRTVRTLSLLRDALLPKLISGQLRLPEAKAVLQDAA